MTVKKDRAFTFIIDKGDKLQSQMVMDSGKALSRQTNEVMIPEFDAYCFKTLADAAIEAGNSDSTAPTKSNAYELFLKGMESLGRQQRPGSGPCDVLLLCVRQPPEAGQRVYEVRQYFAGDAYQGRHRRGGRREDREGPVVPSSGGLRVHSLPPAGSDRAEAAEEFKTHDNPPGISGWLCEGRFIYDCFVLDEKVGGIYYQGGGKLKKLTVQSVGTAAGKSTISLIPDQHDSNGAKWYYNTCRDEGCAAWRDAGHGDPRRPPWTELTAATLEISVTSGHKFIEIVEVDSADKPLAHTIQAQRRLIYLKKIPRFQAGISP